MIKVAILSDTHGYLPGEFLAHINQCDEIWHAGDWGDIVVYDTLAQTKKTIRGVYGNIDGRDLRIIFPEEQHFSVEGMSVFMKHIGGYPGRYAPGVKQKLKELKPHLFISGHSHILKILPDKELNLLHINPGAAGRFGIHKVKTLVLADIEGGVIKDLKVVEVN